MLWPDVNEIQSNSLVIGWSSSISSIISCYTTNDASSLFLVTRYLTLYRLMYTTGTISMCLYNCAGRTTHACYLQICARGCSFQIQRFLLLCQHVQLYRLKSFSCWTPLITYRDNWFIHDCPLYLQLTPISFMSLPKYSRHLSIYMLGNCNSAIA